MKFVLLVDSLGFGGAQRQIVNLAVELKKQGEDVTFICYRKDDFYRPLLEKNNIEPILVSKKGGISRALGIRKIIRSLCPDVVVSFMGPPNLYASLASIGKHSWRLVISERIAIEDVFCGFKARLLKHIQGHYADEIVCNSECAKELWIKHFPKYKNKVKTIYNIIDVPDIETSVSDDGKCRILVAARYEREKNVIGMIKAVSKLSEQEKKLLEIHWYGKANVAINGVSEYDRGQDLIKELGLEACIFLHPATNEIYPLIARTDIIGLFSFSEGFPNAIIEGMSYKKPVIMTKVSDYSVLVDDSNGFLCNPEDEDDITSAIRAVLETTAEQRSLMGQNSYEKIQKLCTSRVVMEKWNQIFKA